MRTPIPPQTVDSHCPKPSLWRHDNQTAYRNGCRCEKARRAKSRYDKRWSLGLNEPTLVDATGTRRRVQALAALGWPIGELTKRLGLTDRGLSFMYAGTTVTPATAQAVAVLYDELCWTEGPSEIAKNRAQRKGWATPLAWDDDEIDDPAAQPKGAVVSHDIDELAVQLAVNGRLGDRHLTRRESHVAIRRMRELGLSTAEIARRARVSDRTVHRQGHEHIKAVA